MPHAASSNSKAPPGRHPLRGEGHHYISPATEFTSVPIHFSRKVGHEPHRQHAEHNQHRFHREVYVCSVAMTLECWQLLQVTPSLIDYCAPALAEFRRQTLSETLDPFRIGNR